ncbi:MAG TPA: RNA 2',3'-cyclic phosphodiesterase [Acidimicrobiales bacterium]|nr:RNA 2',3'-cyclic phosphodiesterase [Acidimicrobiales bacterium]
MRCFVAVWPPPPVLEALAGIIRPQREILRWSTHDQWHITLRFFGELSAPDVDLAISNLGPAVASIVGPLEACGGPATQFLGPHLVIWPVEGLAPLAEAVVASSTRLGQAPSGRPFIGHVTIARSRGGANLRRERELLQPLASSWQVRSVSLVRSELNPKGATYNDLATFNLGEQP